MPFIIVNPLIYINKKLKISTKRLIKCTNYTNYPYLCSVLREDNQIRRFICEDILYIYGFSWY